MRNDWGLFVRIPRRCVWDQDYSTRKICLGSGLFNKETRRQEAWGENGIRFLKRTRKVSWFQAQTERFDKSCFLAAWAAGHEGDRQEEAEHVS